MLQLQLKVVLLICLMITACTHHVSYVPLVQAPLTKEQCAIFKMPPQGWIAKIDGQKVFKTPFSSSDQVYPYIAAISPGSHKFECSIIGSGFLEPFTFTAEAGKVYTLRMGDNYKYRLVTIGDENTFQEIIDKDFPK